MKLSHLVLLVVFSAFATCVSAQPPMPDYSKWDKIADHSFSYLSNDKEVQMRDVHYEYFNQEQPEAFFVIVFYNPDTTKAWFAIYVHLYDDPQKLPETYLYETDKNEAWVFIKNIPPEGTLESLLKTRYNLVEIKK